MNNLMIKIREDTCLSCGSERSMELYDSKNKPVRFTFLLDSNQTNRLINRELEYFKCKHCGKEFRIDMTDPTIPKPLSSIKLEDFMRSFIRK